MNELKAIIEDAFENRDSISPSSAPDEVRDAVAQAIDLLNTGKARVAEKIAGEWVVHQWLKKAVLLFFRLHNNDVIEGAESKFYDKVPLKYTNYTAEQFAADAYEGLVKDQCYKCEDCNSIKFSQVKHGRY